MRLVKVLLILVSILPLTGCEWVAAILLSATTTKTCDPATYEATCVSKHSNLNCTKLQRAGGFKVGDGWSEFRDYCHRGDECRIIEGFAECVAIPEEACDLKVDKERCVAGKKQFCSPLSLYRGDTFWDGKLARWVKLEDSCENSPTP